MFHICISLSRFLRNLELDHVILHPPTIARPLDRKVKYWLLLYSRSSMLRRYLSWLVLLFPVTLWNLVTRLVKFLIRNVPWRPLLLTSLLPAPCPLPPPLSRLYLPPLLLDPPLYSCILPPLRQFQTLRKTITHTFIYLLARHETLRKIRWIRLLYLELIQSLYLCFGHNRCYLNFSSIFRKLNNNKTKVMFLKCIKFYFIYCLYVLQPAQLWPARPARLLCALPGGLVGGAALAPLWDRASPAAAQTRSADSSRVMPTQYLHFPSIILNNYYHLERLYWPKLINASNHCMFSNLPARSLITKIALAHSDLKLK